MDKQKLKSLLERFLKTNETYLFFYKAEEDTIKTLLSFRLSFLAQSENYKYVQIADNENLLFDDRNLGKEERRQIRIDFLTFLINKE